MKKDLILKTCSKSNRYNRYAYIMYMVLVVYFFVRRDYEWSFISLGIATVFDPFDSNVKWQQRPFYQKLWLFVQVAVMLTGLIFLFAIKK